MLINLVTDTETSEEDEEGAKKKFSSGEKKQVDTNVEQKDKENETAKTCTTCDRWFKSQLVYTRHMNGCKSLNKICSICETTFPDGEQMKKHIVTTHEGKLFPCTVDHCYSYFSTKKGFTYHIGNHEEKNFNCGTCKEVFANSTEFMAHKKTNAHKANSKRTECKACKKIFTGRYEENRHWENVCPFNPERPVKCNVCQTRTGKAQDFLVHLKEEHNFKSNYLCTRCLLDFQTQKLLDGHSQTCKVKKIEKSLKKRI